MAKHLAKKTASKKRPSKKPQSGEVRIVGGIFRGRKLPVITKEGLRPTSDRVKETLFNWLQFEISDARCLDVFAGSGSLGFEALSRGAKKVVFLENSVSVVKQLNRNIALLQLPNATVNLTDSLCFLQDCPKESFDVVFIDPPFNFNLMQPTIDLLFKNNWLNSHARLYLEQEKTLNWPRFPEGWICHKEKLTSQVKYGLFKESLNN